MIVLDKAPMILTSRSNAPASDFPNSNYATTSAHDGVVLISSQISNRQIFKFPLFVNSSSKYCGKCRHRFIRGALNQVYLHKSCFHAQSSASFELVYLWFSVVFAIQNHSSISAI